VNLIFHVGTSTGGGDRHILRSWGNEVDGSDRIVSKCHDHDLTLTDIVDCRLAYPPGRVDPHQDALKSL
jgi:hypothetical protein